MPDRDQVMDALVGAILSGAFGLALWAAWRPRYRVASYLLAAAIAVALVAVLLVIGNTDMVIVSAGMLALFGSMVIFNHRRAQRTRSRTKR
ncbi:hypothetical protein [Mycobacterium gastri]|uniref:hypothetical protein n=1 Tax=Mycobacterium gastri TaxID=1777 RepID=UPI001FC9ABE1|nr:hypothetical protein [Mycobacterium gastri]